ncbi:hypothetical protein KIL84_003030 [Mauremys mutica]|uniref:Uncharacterized protein n=1 Tax=Mauremys mutica TaxID=74926 RepID=A0A9D4AML8_9SAUR|nr:hypothetical protein KIL84_003030 [Mauremys mutica]
MWPCVNTSCKSPQPGLQGPIGRGSARGAKEGPSSHQAGKSVLSCSLADLALCTTPAWPQRCSGLWPSQGITPGQSSTQRGRTQNNPPPSQGQGRVHCSKAFEFGF